MDQSRVRKVKEVNNNCVMQLDSTQRLKERLLLTFSPAHVFGIASFFCLVAWQKDASLNLIALSTEPSCSALIAAVKRLSSATSAQAAAAVSTAAGSEEDEILRFRPQMGAVVKVKSRKQSRVPG